ATNLGYVVHRSNKYQNPLFRKFLPILRHQGNALLTKNNFSGQFHFFPRGMKRLIIEVDCQNFTLFLIHLALSKKIRAIQIRHLIELAKKSPQPYIIAGDFNTFSGEEELNELLTELNLINANIDKNPTFPSWKPKFQIDYILHSTQIKLLNFSIPKINLSDHLPLIAEFDISL
ncbi:MAG: endonuclease/exonuclease/phosphatase family protein, partial [Lentisphaeria bacterium]